MSQITRATEGHLYQEAINRHMLSEEQLQDLRLRQGSTRHELAERCYLALLSNLPPEYFPACNSDPSPPENAYLLIR